ncbi:hypothetical protein CHARACLAT_026756 [Characodon lateralis]|uniref:Secreted protein n=1 Tax=Characodon lateralis TaxID=208331 RepID=A0ABU7DNU9_9TELE|nr:hypothetical protein [Characodon lateralis]
MRVGMCDCDCMCLFFVSGWVLNCSLSWISLGPKSNVGPISSPSHYLPVVGVSARWCTVVLRPLVYCGSPFPGLDALVCAASLLVAACRGLDPWALSGLCLGSNMSRGLWVNGWICSGVDSYRRGLWALHCISLGPPHCGCWVVPL